MRTLKQNEINDVNGGVLVTAGVIIGSFIGGYIYGRLTKKEPKSEQCKPNPATGSQCA
jgi:hypothetical protein